MSRTTLTARQADTVDRLGDAAVDEICAVGYDGLTVRNVARRAGVAPATAYTYFASKDHLVAEVFWRRLHALPPSRIDGRRSAAARVAAALRDVTQLLAAEPELAAAATVAMLATDPAVKQLRDRIGLEIRLRVADALGADGDRGAVRALDLAISGAMLQAGMGHLNYDELPDRLAEVVALLLGAHR
ncbi:MAG TPA: helix-turn-helix domain-containing protein [Acidimicrobiales bacterium]|nr:helix-turn-helix domain-containing protein [Acidimicrobiales bacterium]